MNCNKCKIRMAVVEAADPNGLTYNFYRCKKCGEELLDMSQLKKIADKYRAMRKYTVKISSWGNSRGIRIPKELEKEYGLENKNEVFLLPEKESIRIIAK